MLASFAKAADFEKTVRRVPLMRSYRVGDFSAVCTMFRSRKPPLTANFKACDAERDVAQTFAPLSQYPDAVLIVADRRTYLAAIAWGHQFLGLVTQELAEHRSALEDRLGNLERVFVQQRSFVHEKDVGAGLELALLNALREQARKRGYRWFALKVSAFDSRSLRLHANMGFRAVLGLDEGQHVLMVLPL
jgi:GNAT superfamily N-acetyltransferase